MALAEFKTARISQINDIHIDTGKTLPVLLDTKIFHKERNFWTNSGVILGLMFNLFNAQEEYGKILGYPHTERGGADDLLELMSPFVTNTLGFYCTKDGETVFSLRDGSFTKESKRGEAPKVDSTQTEFGDARLTADFLGNFRHMIHSDVRIDGPTNTEPFIVMTSPEGEGVRTIGRCDKGDIIGVVLKPIIGGDNRIVHGDVQLLLRGKPYIL